MNVTKTKGLVINFRRANISMDPIVIRGRPVEMVANYKCLGAIIDNKLDWPSNTEVCCKKENQRMYFLRKLKQFQVDKKIVSCFTIRCAISATPGRQTRSDWTRLQGQRQGSWGSSTVKGSVAAKKLHSILSDTQHSLNHVLSPHVSRRFSSQRLRCFRTRTSRLRDSFMPVAVRLHNSSL